MQNDEMIWQVINHQFCSFKTTIGSALEKQRRHFCRHEYSITGLCNRSSCPLANSKYATVREVDGRVDLYIKTVERAHTPKNLWQKIKLSRNYTKALAQLDEQLMYFPKNMQHRNKQRLTKIHQYLIRMRKIKLKQRAGKGVKLTRVHRKVEQREERREKKALVAANLEKSIETELVSRLAKGTYGDIYNFPEVPYQKALEEAEDDQSETESLMEGEEEESDEEEGIVEYVEDFDEEDEEEYESDVEDIRMDTTSESELDESDEDDESSDDSDDSDDQSTGKMAKGAKKKTEPKRGTRVEIEYEEENEEEAQAEEQLEAVAGMAW